MLCLSPQGAECSTAGNFNKAPNCTNRQALQHVFLGEFAPNPQAMKTKQTGDKRLLAECYNNRHTGAGWLNKSI